MNSEKFLHRSIVAMRIVLGIIFLWFGLLKVFGVSPVEDFVKITTPILGSDWGWQALGIFEVILGVGLIFKIAQKLLLSALILHIVGTFSTFFTSPEIMFQNWPWLLTFEGEFVIKNLVLGVGGIIILSTALQHKNENDRINK